MAPASTQSSHEEVDLGAMAAGGALDNNEGSGAGVGGLDEDLEGAAAELDLEDASEFEDDEDADQQDEGPSALGDDLEDEDMEVDGGAPVSPSAIPMIGMPGGSTKQGDATETQSSLHPTKPIPYVVDAGHLLISDPNPLEGEVSQAEPRLSETVLSSTARDAAQSLINTLLTTCAITSVKNASGGSGIVMNLPAPSLALPREKAVPTPKPPTKWEQFAAKKGIGKNKRKHQDGENRAGKMEYDESRGEWVPRYGYKGKNRAGERAAIVEIDPKEEKKQAQEGKAGKDPRTSSRAERVERIKRNERKMRANERKASKKGS